MTFQILLERQRLFEIKECNVCLYEPLTFFAGVGALAGIVFAQSSINVIGDADIPMLMISRFQDVDIVHA